MNTSDVKRILIMRKRINEVTWFVIVGKDISFLVDYPLLKIIQDSGVEIYDVDAILSEMARNN